MAGAFKALGTSGGSSGGSPPGRAGRPSPSGGSSPSPRRAEARSEPGAGDTVADDVTATVVTLNRVRTTESVSSEPAGDWVEGGDGHTAPEGYPIKVKTRSGIYHEPGGRMYERTNADRWYRTTEAAEADGFRASKTT